MAALKISMACWLLADEGVTRAKIAAAQALGVPTTTGGGPFEIARALGSLPGYLDLCADMGFTRIECGQGFTQGDIKIDQVMSMARCRGLEVQFELGSKHGGPFTSAVVRRLLEVGRRWLDAGAAVLVVEARENARDVGLFDRRGRLNQRLADRFAGTFGLTQVVYEAPTKRSQFALMDHFGAEVRLSNVRLEEILRVEIYRYGLHSDSFGRSALRSPAAGTPVAFGNMTRARRE